MAKTWGKADFSQLQQLRENLAKLEEADMRKFCEETSRELAARLLALVIPRTPVGKTVKAPDAKGRMRTVHVGGTLRRGWTARTETEAQKRSGGISAAEYAKSLSVEKVGDLYQITVINPVNYASYVEFGRRQTPGRFVPAIGKRLKRGWVPGQYMLTISERQLQRIAPDILEKKLQAFLSEVFNV